jgi:hypothetical protein
MGIGQDLPLCVITESLKLFRIKKIGSNSFDRFLSPCRRRLHSEAWPRVGFRQIARADIRTLAKLLPGYFSKTLPIELILMKTTQLITVIPKNPRAVKGETITHVLLFLSSNNRCTSLKVGTKSASF